MLNACQHGCGQKFPHERRVYLVMPAPSAHFLSLFSVTRLAGGGGGEGRKGEPGRLDGSEGRRANFCILELLTMNRVHCYQHFPREAALCFSFLVVPFQIDDRA